MTTDAVAAAASAAAVNQRLNATSRQRHDQTTNTTAVTTQSEGRSSTTATAHCTRHARPSAYGAVAVHVFVAKNNWSVKPCFTRFTEEPGRLQPQP